MFHTKSKSQASVEFVIILFFGILLFSGSLYAFQEKSKEITFQKDYLKAKEVVHTISDSVNNAYLGIGCNRKIYLPTEINKKSFNLTYLNSSHLLILYWSNGFYSFPIISSSIKINTTIKNEHYLNCTGGISFE